MVGKTNASAGGENLKDTDALLKVAAPAGSIVTITKSGITKSDQGHQNAEDPSVYDYYFIIHSNQFDQATPWNITASLNSKTKSTTLLITANKTYEVKLTYELVLYDAGNAYGYPWKIIKEDVSSYSDPTGTTLLVQQNGGGNTFPDSGFAINQKIDLTQYSYLCAHIVRTEYVAKTAVFVSSDITPGGQFYKYIATNPGDALASTIVETLPDGNIVRCDISSLQGQEYVNVGARCSGHTVTLLFEVDRVWLE